ncbi:MAG: hypothetical protein ABWY25_06110 [Paenisporosarcina sp.]
MHSSVVKAKEYRDRELVRRRRNVRRREANAILMEHGYDPAFIPSKYTNTRAERQTEYRRKKDFEKFLKGLMQLF